MTDTPEAVSLRPLRLDDAERVLAWRNLPEVAAYMYTDHRISEDEHARWFAQVLDDETRRYWIIELDRRPIGLANLYDISTHHKRGYCGSYLASTAVRGRGLGTAAERLLVRHAFADLGLDKLCTEVLSGNDSGVNVHARCGFQTDGVLRQHVLKGGKRHDVVAMSLLRAEWAASAAAAGD
jgi:UDP-4-amino-4,6-dideoxy-N-acetyl-beta-L-altrosamine N-acetyltransferase